METPFVIFEDNHLFALYKPAGMAVVPDSSGDYSLLDWGKDYIKKTRKKPGNVFLAVIHRIDRPVSGLVLFARTSKAASRLSDQMRRRLIHKEYLAVVSPKPNKKSGVIETHLKKDRRRNTVRVVAPKEIGAKFSVTNWKALENSGDLGLLLLSPATGRSHQLRVHTAQVLGSPILGDIKYGSKELILEGRGIALHSCKMTVTHPTLKESMSLVCPVPDYYPFDIFQATNMSKL